MKSVKDLTNATGLSRQRINKLLKTGKIPAIKFGDLMYMIEDKDFDKFLKDRENNPDLRLKKI
jgi:excisionase family DNA binding protein